MEDDTPKIDILLRRVPAVKAFCVLIDVETGTAIVSYAGLISGIIWFIVDLIYLSIYIDLFPFDQKLKPVVKHMTGILIFDTLLELAYCGAFVYLIIGYNKEKPRYIRRWLLIIIVLNLGKLCSTICVIIFGSPLIFLISLGYTAFHIYYFIVVNTFYQDMDDGGRHY